MATFSFPAGGGAPIPVPNIPHVGLFGGQAARNTTGLPATIDGQPVPQPAATGGATPAPGGFTPNWAQNILTDPIYRQLQQQVAAQNQAAQGGFTSGLGQALGQFGEIPDLASVAQQMGLNASSPLYSLLLGAANDPNTQQSAHDLTNAGLSTEGMLAQEHQTALQTLVNSLAARGALESGDAGVGAKLEEQANAQRQYAANQSLLQTLGNLVNAYNASQQQGVSQLQQGAQQAAARQIALNPSVPESLAGTIASLFTTPTPVAATTASGATSG